MAGADTHAEAKTGEGTESAAAHPPLTAVPFHYTQTESFVTLLHHLGAALLVTTYQANKLLVARATREGLSMLVRTFDQPMGLAVDGAEMVLGTRTGVWTLRNAPDIAPRIDPPGRHDACYLPRSNHITGDIRVHEIAWGTPHPQPLSPQGRGEEWTPHPQPLSPKGRGERRTEREVWVVNTRFSCLCTLHPDYSFVPRWRPPFITALTAEDRCHLNGLAMVDGQPKYVTALGETDTVTGWRANKPRGGCLMEVSSGAFISRGLSMPHSPRWHDGRLWVLESGTGQLVLVDAASGSRQNVAAVPGFARGLAFAGPYAFIGLSKIRKTSAMDGVPLAEQREQLKCGVAVVDVRSGHIIAFLEFQTAVEEIFDVQLLPGLRFPEVVGFQQDTIQHTFVIPPA